MLQKLLAKSQKQGGTLLLDHTKMVLNMGYAIASELSFFNDQNFMNFKKEILVSLILHDIGKCSSVYQEIMLKNKELDDEDIETPIKKKNSSFYYHNTISWAFALSCIKGIRPTGRDATKHLPIITSILYHHTVKNCLEKDTELKPCNIINSLTESELDIMCKFYNEMCSYVKQTFDIDILSDKDYMIVDDFYEYTGDCISKATLFCDFNAFNSDAYYLNSTIQTYISRAILNYSDRMVSSLDYDNDKILKNDTEYILNIFNDRFNKELLNADFEKYDTNRLKTQMSIIDECFTNDTNTNIIGASAGFGKTLMGILTYLKYQKKTLWVLPTLELCRATYRSVIEEIKNINLSQNISVGLFYSNGFVEGDINSDIIIIGIDALLGRLSKNNITPLLIDSLFANVIFDEYHEFLMTQPLFAGFISLIKARKDFIHSNTFLLSATYLNFDNLWGSSNIKYWEDMPILGENIKIHIHCKEIDSVLGQYDIEQQENCITIMPTVDSAQFAYAKTSDSMLIHSRYNTEDRAKKIEEAFNEYGKFSTVKHKRQLIGTSIIGTGFDISAKILNDYIITPMRTIQTIGRGARFCEYDEIEYNIITSQMTIDKGISKLVSSITNSNIRSRWIEELSAYNDKMITKKDMYNIYNSFMNKNKKAWDKYFEECFKESARNLVNIKYTSGLNKINNEKKLNTSYTFRGESNNFYATIKLNNDEYMNPIICDGNILYRENSDSDADNNDAKTRYQFMLSKNEHFEFPNKNILKYKWKIKNGNDATVEKCMALATSEKTPLLLINYNYNSKFGLYRRELFNV